MSQNDNSKQERNWDDVARNIISDLLRQVLQGENQRSYRAVKVQLDPPSCN